jgi:hypothetical protein
MADEDYNVEVLESVPKIRTANPILLDDSDWGVDPIDPESGLQIQQVQLGWMDTVKTMWSGGAAVASGAASAGSGVITAVRWWDKHGGQVKIGAALVGGGLLGLFVWKLIR